MVIEQFSNDCLKTNTKVIIPTNDNRSKQRDEPIRITLQLPVTCSKRGKNRTYKVQSFCFSLVEKLARDFQANYKVSQSQSRNYYSTLIWKRL